VAAFKIHSNAVHSFKHKSFMKLINVSKEELINVHSVYMGRNICCTVQLSPQWLSKSLSSIRLFRDRLIYDNIYSYMLITRPRSPTVCKMIMKLKKRPGPTGAVEPVKKNIYIHVHICNEWRVLENTATNLHVL
jgi:hypothetical protein